MSRWDVLAGKICEMLEGHRLVFVFAPTSYGKTMASPPLLRRARGRGLASRLIHVVPVRTLLREIYLEKFANSGFHAGYQSMDRLPGEGKSPYFLSDIVVTTVDSFLWNIYKIPVAEVSKVIDGRSEGHYYPALAAIATSIVVFDEAHLYIGELGGDERVDVVTPAVEALYRLGIGTVVATATMSRRYVQKLVKEVEAKRGDVGVVYACSENCNNHVAALEKEFHVEYVDGLDVELEWETKFVEGDVGKVIEEECKGGVVLTVANTVERAVELYREANCGDKTLIHSRLVEEERRKAEEKMRQIRESRRGLVVASPIVEVGVEVDADVLITDAAPLDNLIQRAGRLCRSKKSCMGGMGRIYIIKNAPPGPYEGGDIERVVEKLEPLVANGCIEWRRFDSRGCTPIVDILDEIQDVRIFSSRLLSGYLTKDKPPSALVDNVDITKLFRSMSLVKVVVNIDGCKSVGDLIDCVDRRSFTTNIHALRALEKKARCLSVEGEKASAWLLVTRGRKVSLKPLSSKVLYRVIYGKLNTNWIRELNGEVADSLDEGEGALQLFLELKDSCYKPGEGAYV